MKEKILVSACLLGRLCRYDGRQVPCKEVIQLKDRYDFVEVCPEVMGGLPTPRIPSERVNDKVINKAGIDVSVNYKKGAEIALELCKKHGIKIALLKEKSPSCGSRGIYDGSFGGVLIPGEGVTAELLRKNGIKVYGESEVDKLLQLT